MKKNRNETNEEYFARLDAQYPNRHKLIHKNCCKYCPSKNGATDPECEDMKELPKELIAKEYLFVCAWRNSKACKGFADNMGIDQEFLDKLYGKKA